MECAGRDSQHSSNSGGVDSSFSNPEEASIVVDIARRLITGPNRMKPSDIGIITPYSGQVPHYLKVLIKTPSESNMHVSWQIVHETYIWTLCVCGGCGGGGGWGCVCVLCGHALCVYIHMYAPCIKLECSHVRRTCQSWSWYCCLPNAGVLGDHGLSTCRSEEDKAAAGCWTNKQFWWMSNPLMASKVHNSV